MVETSDFVKLYDPHGKQLEVTSNLLIRLEDMNGTLAEYWELGLEPGYYYLTIDRPHHLEVRAYRVTEVSIDSSTIAKCRGWKPFFPVVRPFFPEYGWQIELPPPDVMRANLAVFSDIEPTKLLDLAESGASDGPSFVLAHAWFCVQSGKVAHVTPILRAAAPECSRTVESMVAVAWHKVAELFEGRRPNSSAR